MVSPFFCINTTMASITNLNNRVFNMSPNIVVALDDNNMGEMYIYDHKYRYVLNGITASDLINYFADNGDNLLSNEIMETMMEMTINTGNH